MANPTTQMRMNDGRLRCSGCGMPYASESWSDFVIPDEAWERISPASGGVLCVQCMIDRANAAGVSCVGQFTSGPFADHKWVKSAEHRAREIDAATPEDAQEAYTSHTGATCIDWDDDPKNQLSIIAKDGHVTFAAFHNGQKAHGEAKGTEFMSALRRFAGEPEGAQAVAAETIRDHIAETMQGLSKNYQTSYFRDDLLWAIKCMAPLHTHPPADAEDAARYRFLRDPENHRPYGRQPLIVGRFYEELDAAIDAAIDGEGD